MPTERTTETGKDKLAGQPAWTSDSRAMTPRPQEALKRRAPTSARALGWFSVGLGAAQLLAPGALARLIGARDTSGTRLILRALGAREVTSGLAILRGERTERWLWGRAVGDAMDLGFLGAAWSARRSDHMRLGATGAAVAGVAVLDVLAARRAHRGEETAPGGVEVSRSVTIKTSPKELHRFWRSLGNLPRFMAHLESVETIDDRRSHWRVRGPAGMKVEWEAEIVEDRPGELIAWRSLEGSDVHNEGEVRFVAAPGGRGTEVHVALRYRAMGGAVGRALARLFGSDPGQQIAGDLRRLKQVIETGEVVHSDASIHRSFHPAQPSSSVLEFPGTGKRGA